MNKEDFKSVTRLEIIDHSSPMVNKKGEPLPGKGRTVVYFDNNKELELALHDGGMTLKIFVSDRHDN